MHRQRRFVISLAAEKPAKSSELFFQSVNVYLSLYAVNYLLYHVVRQVYADDALNGLYRVLLVFCRDVRVALYFVNYLVCLCPDIHFYHSI